MQSGRIKGVAYAITVVITIPVRIASVLSPAQTFSLRVESEPAFPIY